MMGAFNGGEEIYNTSGTSGTVDDIAKYTNSAIPSLAMDLGPLGAAPTHRADGSILQVGDRFTLVSNPAAPALYIYGNTGFANLAGSAATNASAVSFVADFTGATAKAVLLKSRESQSILDASGNAPGATYEAFPAFGIVDILAGEILIPRGIHKVSTQNTGSGWVGRYRIQDGAKIQPAAGIFPKWNNAHFDTHDFNAFIDHSQGGYFTGTILNNYESAAWHGLNQTNGGAANGVAMNYCLSSLLTLVKQVPYGTYQMGNSVLTQTTCHVVGPASASIDSNNYPTLLWDTDRGTAGDALSTSNYYWYFPSNTKIPTGLPRRLVKGLKLQFGSNTGANKGMVPNWNTDGFMLGDDGGNGSASGDGAVTFENLVISGGRFGIVTRFSNGHSVFNSIEFASLFCSVAFIRTGGDFRFIDVDSASNQLATFFAWTNTGAEQGMICEDVYSALQPWVFYQPANLTHPARDASIIEPFGVYMSLKRTGTERIGNGFFFMPSSGITNLYMEDSGWDLNATDTDYDIYRERDSSGNLLARDYANKVAYLAGIIKMLMNENSITNGGTLGIFYGSNYLALNIKDLPSDAPSVPFFTTPNNQSLVTQASAALPEIVFQAGETSHTFSLDRFMEASLSHVNAPIASRHYVANENDAAIIPYFLTNDGGPIRGQTSTTGEGASATIKLSAAPTGPFVVRLRMYD